MSICTIVLNWQGWQDTLACLDSLLRLKPIKPTTIVVCDNNSQDDSFEQIFDWAQQHYVPIKAESFKQINSNIALEWNSSDHSTFPAFVLIQTGANRGFAAGNNTGIRYALEKNFYDYLWLLNNDTSVDPQALSALYEYAVTHPQTALIGSTLVHDDKRDYVQCAGGCYYFPLLTVFKNYLGDQPLSLVMQYSDKVKLDYICGASMFLCTTVVKQVGLLNEDYFLFYEELDYTHRLRKQGYEIGWCKQSLVYHKGSASVGNRRAGNRQKLQQANYYENLSTLKFSARFYPQWLFLIMLIRLGLKSVALLTRGDLYLLPSLFNAYRDFIICRHENNRSA